MIPVRLQRSRVKGSQLVSPNGLPIVCCTRPGKYSNPFKVGQPGITDKASTIRRFKTIRNSPDFRFINEHDRIDLEGKNLACWCKLCPKHSATGKPLNESCADCAPCHVDVIAEILYPKSGAP